LQQVVHERRQVDRMIQQPLDQLRAVARRPAALLAALLLLRLLFDRGALGHGLPHLDFRFWILDSFSESKSELKK